MDGASVARAPGACCHPDVLPRVRRHDFFTSSHIPAHGPPVPCPLGVLTPSLRLRLTRRPSKSRDRGGAVRSARAQVQGEGEVKGPEEPAVVRVPLGRSGLQVPQLGVGTLQWGDASCGFGFAYTEADLREAFRTLTAEGLNFFDTAEVYGYKGIPTGDSSEHLLGKFEKEAQAQAGAPLAPTRAAGDASPPQPQGQAAVIATKFFTIPWTNLLVGGGFRLGRQSLLDALHASLARLGRDRVDLYQIHFPFPTFSNAALMEALGQAVDEGLTAAVGVSNFSPKEMEEAHALLAQRGIPLASNQVRYSLLARKPETNGLLQACRDLGVSLVAYSPLATGVLSDKALRMQSTSEARKALPLLKALDTIGQSLGGKSISQVALGYLIHKGAIPIPACKNKAQAEAHIDTLSIVLSDDQVLRLQEAAAFCGH